MSDDRTGPRPVSTIMVIGCGLMGGSIALATRAADDRTRVIGVDRSAVLAAAEARGAVERGYVPGDLLEAFERERPELVVLAAGVSVIESQLLEVARHASEQPPSRRPLVIDVGSVKQPIVTEAERVALPRFVGGHPMSGRERGGIEHADAELLRGCCFVLCPTRHTAPDDLAQAQGWVTRWGARPRVMSPELHDQAVAAVSHLPHLAAWSLMLTAEATASAHEPDLPWALAAGSFRDVTRVAGADPHLWDDILRANRGPVREALARWIEALQAVDAALARGEGPVLEALDAVRLSSLRRSLDPALCTKNRSHE